MKERKKDSRAVLAHNFLLDYRTYRKGICPSCGLRQRHKEGCKFNRAVKFVESLIPEK